MNSIFIEIIASREISRRKFSLFFRPLGDIDVKSIIFNQACVRGSFSYT